MSKVLESVQGRAARDTVAARSRSRGDVTRVRMRVPYAIYERTDINL